MASDAESTSPSRPVGRIAASVRDLHPGYFAFVMATGIISTGTSVLGPVWLSRTALALACAGFVVLLVALVLRLILYRAALAQDLRAPERVFGFFTLVAGMDVLGARLAAAGHPLATVILTAAAALAWLALTYGVPAGLFLARQRDSILPSVNGSWLIWVVATQSLSIEATVLMAQWGSRASLLSTLAVALWSIGLVLYLVLIALIMVRWLSVAMTPDALGPPYWILMGATAITVLAGAHILGLSRGLPIARATAGFVEGWTFALWAFGTWWIPLILVMGFWRHVGRRWPLTYEPTLWSIVFPLGMYSVATWSFGQAAGLAFMGPLSRVMIWVAVAAWVLVALAFVLRGVRRRATPIRAR